MRGMLLTLLVLAVCWPAWWAAGQALAWAGLAWFDLPGRVALLFLALGGVRLLLEPAHGAAQGDEHG